jgi:glycine/D-amino acid oxidase-like deaminating enzyme
MTTTPGSVVVIGGGVLGMAAAADLARRGVATTVVTQGPLADGASGRSLSWLNSAGQRSRAYHDLRLAGIDRYRGWAERRPEASRYLRFTGGLTWADPGESYRPRFEHESSLGYPSRWLAPDEVAAVVPGVDPCVVAAEGAIFNPGEAWVDLPSLVADLARDVTSAGGHLITGAGQTRPVVEDGAVVGARSANGDHWSADAVLLATGPAVPRQLRAMDVVIPDASTPAMVVFTEPAGTILSSVLNTPRVAVRPTVDGGLAIDAGWSERELVVDRDGTITAATATVEGLLEAASEVLDEHPVLDVDHLGIGWKPIPGDGEPVLGAVDTVEGLYVAFTHSGATLGLVAGELLGEAIAGAGPSPLMAPFTPARFLPPSPEASAS